MHSHPFVYKVIKYYEIKIEKDEIFFSYMD